MRFHEYIAKRDKIPLEEAARRSLARVWGMTGTGRHFGLITAFRGERDYKQNVEVNKALMSDLRKMGFGFIPVIGGTIEKVRDAEGKETGETTRVEEESLVVSAPKMPKEQFHNAILYLIHKYKQEAALIKYADGEEAYELKNSGEASPIGKWSPDQLSKYYTRMRYGTSNRQFTFEYADDCTMTTQRAIYYFEKSLNNHDPLS